MYLMCVLKDLHNITRMDGISPPLLHTHHLHTPFLLTMEKRDKVCSISKVIRKMAEVYVCRFQIGEVLLGCEIDEN